MEEPGRAVLIYDGDCRFCGRWIARWRARTGDLVEYVPYQRLGARFAALPRTELALRVHLVEPDGSVCTGAAAVLRALAIGRASERWWWAYRHVPGVAPAAEGLYRVVASHRVAASRAARLVEAKTEATASYRLARNVVLRGMGAIYLIAFASVLVQVQGLFGSHGVLPIASYLGALAARFGAEAHRLLPTVFWLDASDAALRSVCLVGAVAGLALMLGVAPLPSAIVAWVAYLSIVNAGQVFFHFQWDILLLEAGLLAVLLSPAAVRPRSWQALPVRRLPMWLLRWLLFRLMFASGLVKLASGDPAWRNLTALAYHYESQPLPPPTAWYLHQLPLWFQKASTAAMFGIELIVPFFIFGPRRLRLLAFWLLAGFQVLIIASGNYGFFNLLTIVLCVSLVDDRAMARWLPAGWARLASARAVVRSRAERAAAAVATLAALVVALASYGVFAGRFLPRGYAPAPLRSLVSATGPYHVANGYGLFAVMTKGRSEIVIEGSDDGRTWKPYEFKWKPGDPLRAPSFVEPHMPRLDWQMWFAALGSYRQNPWLTHLLVRLTEGSPPVLALLDSNPFSDRPPRYVRAVLYRYRFTRMGEANRSDAWWTRELRGLYHPVVTRREPTSAATDGAVSR